MKKYEAPELEILTFETEDILTESDPITGPNEGPIA